MSDERILDSRKSEGQALIQVALAMIVLLLLVGLAVDVGGTYAERRHMQNAADAGALAGAWELCYGDPDPVVVGETAEQYATERNRAQLADVDIIYDEETGAPWIVWVEASTVAETYLTGVIGINDVPVAAQAAAACGNVNNLCNVWPLTFNRTRWNDLPCDATFYVWDDDRLLIDNPILDVELADGTRKGMLACDLCDCNDISDLPGDAYYVGSGNRGWVNFPKVQEPYTDPNNCGNNCGTQQLKCVISGQYNGALEIPPGGTCLRGKPGVNGGVQSEIEKQFGQNVNLLLWDRMCQEGDHVTPTCNASGFDAMYHIVGTGCFVPLDNPKVSLAKKSEFEDVQIHTDGWLKNNKFTCINNIQTIVARKNCECNSECGSTSGNRPPEPGEVRGVSLINWPP